MRSFHYPRDRSLTLGDASWVTVASRALLSVTQNPEEVQQLIDPDDFQEGSGDSYVPALAFLSDSSPASSAMTPPINTDEAFPVQVPIVHRQRHTGLPMGTKRRSDAFRNLRYPWPTQPPKPRLSKVLPVYDGSRETQRPPTPSQREKQSKFQGFFTQQGAKSEDSS
jgi:hypothetical protein